MSTLTKIAIVLLLALGIFGGGFYLGKGNKEVVIQEKIIKGDTVIKEVETIVTVTKTVHPDGTTTETTTTDTKQKDTHEQESTTDKSSSSKSIASNWGVGIGVVASLKDAIDNKSVKELPKPDYYGMISHRVLGDIWVDLQANTNKEIAGGIRVEF